LQKGSFFHQVQICLSPSAAATLRSDGRQSKLPSNDS
jgi:hypothetical protein